MNRQAQAQVAVVIRVVRLPVVADRRIRAAVQQVACRRLLLAAI